MFKNKKGSVKQESAEETFSLTALDIPVVKEGSPSPLPIPGTEQAKVVHREKPERKKRGSNVLWAKVLVAVIVGFVLVLSLYKFVEYLNVPKIRFKEMVDVVYSDFIEMLDILEEDDLYNAIAMDSYKIVADSKVVASNLENKDNHLEDVLNTLKFTSNIEVDRDNRYINGQLAGSVDTIEKFNLSFIEKSGRRYVRIPNIYNTPIELETVIDLINFSPELAKRVLEVIKRNVLDNFEEARFSSYDESIGLNGKTVDCLKSTYSFSNVETEELFDRIYSSIKSDSSSYTFLANLFGEDTSGLDERFKEFKNRLGLSFDGTYYFSAFTNKYTNEGVRLELSYVDESSDRSIENTIAYNRDFSYRGIEIKDGNDIRSISVKGDLTNTFTVNVVSGNGIYNLTTRLVEDGREGAVVLIDKNSGETKEDAKFSYTLKNVSNSAYSMANSIEYKKYDRNTTENYMITSSVLINGGPVKIENPIKSSIKLSDFEKEAGDTIEAKFREMLGKISLESSQVSEERSPNRDEGAPEMEDEQVGD